MFCGGQLKNSLLIQCNSNWHNLMSRSSLHLDCGYVSPSVRHNDLRMSSKRWSGAEKKGLWSVSMTITFLGGQRWIMASCCSTFNVRSFAVFMYTRWTAFTGLSTPSPTQPNFAVWSTAGNGRSRMEASRESCTNVNNECAGEYPSQMIHSLQQFVHWPCSILYIQTSWELCWYRIVRWNSFLSIMLVGGWSSPRPKFRSYTSPNSDKSGTPCSFPIKVLGHASISYTQT